MDLVGAVALVGAFYAVVLAAGYLARRLFLAKRTGHLAVQRLPRSYQVLMLLAATPGFVLLVLLVLLLTRRHA
jgi:hypothetical protein